MKVLIVFAAIAVSAFARPGEVRVADIAPEEASQYINNQDQTLRYAPKIESNVPAVRFIGDHPEQVVEDIYLANQYHGQDGLGNYIYGYSAPDIAKTEKKQANDVRGEYQYVSNGQEIKVKYWDEGNGFHQEDNVPKILPKQVDDAPDVKAAKEEHLRRWKEEAERNSRPPAYPYTGGLQPTYKENTPNNYNNIEYTGEYSENQQNYAATSTEDPNKWVYKPSEEEQGPPRGFFYNFDYAVPIIVSKQGSDYQKRDLGQIYTQNAQNFNQQLKAGSGNSGSYQIHS